MAGDLVAHLDGAQAAFFDVEVDVVARAGGFVEGDLVDQEVLVVLLDDAADAGDVAGQVHGRGDMRVETLEVGLLVGADHHSSVSPGSGVAASSMTDSSTKTGTPEAMPRAMASLGRASTRTAEPSGPVRLRRA